MIRKGCIYHLVRVADTTSEVSVPESVPVVNAFLEVFLDELPGIPPDREVDFRIDVLPDTRPISIPPYRMAPVELRELKEQLKDLLEKGFIRPKKANVVAGTISQKYMGSLDHLGADQRPLARKVYQLASQGVRISTSNEGKVMVRNGAESSLVAEVKEKQLIDPALAQMKEAVLNNKTSTYSLGGEDGVLRCQGRLCVPDVDNLRGRVIAEAHNSSFHVSIQMAPFEALYGRRCRSPIGWFEVGETELLGPDLVHQAMVKVKIIQERLKAAQSRQKSYADIRRKKLKFQVDDWVFLRVSPMKGVMRFGKKGKLSPRYVGPYRVTQRIGHVAYSLELPPEMSLVHPVFHVSMLKNVVGDPSTIVPIEAIEVNEELSYEEIPSLFLIGKANVVADALSRRSLCILAYVEVEKRELAREIHQLACLGVQLVDSDDGGVALQNTATSYLIVEEKERQYEDPELVELRERVPQQKKPVLDLKGDGVPRYKGHLCISDVAGL
ncbi:uncharacterized protein [Nicotiana sylvestris]|uniref:uncharacterized protein n=1 Tax=Nicotiana sylvestris TaxID=4096 RepID=UPI00388CE1BD